MTGKRRGKKSIACKSMLNLELWNESSFHMSTLNLLAKKFLILFSWQFPLKTDRGLITSQPFASDPFLLMINVLFLPKMLWFSTYALAMILTICAFGMPFHLPYHWVVSFVGFIHCFRNSVFQRCNVAETMLCFFLYIFALNH